jgi:hypothetical protein
MSKDSPEIIRLFSEVLTRYAIWYMQNRERIESITDQPIDVQTAIIYGEEIPVKG